jgi:uncharacterized membrane protein
VCASALAVDLGGMSWETAAVTLACAWIGREASKRTRVGSALSGPVSAMLLGCLAANACVLPSGSGTELSELQRLCAFAATPMLLFGGDLKNAMKSTSSMAAPFVVGALGTCVGAVVGCALVFGGGHGGSVFLENGDSWKLVAALTAKNVGGGLNYVAVATTLGLSPEAFTAGIAADNVFALLYFPFVSYLAKRNNDDVADDEAIVDDETDDDGKISLDCGDVLVVALASCALLAAGARVAPNAILPATTALTVMCATILPERITSRLSVVGAIVGDALLYVFFVCAGAATGSLSAIATRADVFSFLLILYAIHISVVLCASKIFSKFWTFPQALLASNANVGGPATVAALAADARWRSLLAPSVLVATLGNSFATFLALALTGVFQSL